MAKKKYRYVDEFFAAVLNFSTIGLGYLVIGEKKRFFITLGVQIALLIGAGMTMYINSLIPTLMYIVYIGFAGWTVYDVFTMARYINEYIRYSESKRK